MSARIAIVVFALAAGACRGGATTVHYAGPAVGGCQAGRPYEPPPYTVAAAPQQLRQAPPAAAPHATTEPPPTEPAPAGDAATEAPAAAPATEAPEKPAKKKPVKKKPAKKAGG
jgi:hypothetical protein